MSQSAAERFETAKWKLLCCQPEAIEIRQNSVGCPHCHGYLVLTYAIPDYHVRGPFDETIEFCGFYCPSCEHLRFGARKKSDGDT